MKGLSEGLRLLLAIEKTKQVEQSANLIFALWWLNQPLYEADLL